MGRTSGGAGRLYHLRHQPQLFQDDCSGIYPSEGIPYDYAQTERLYMAFDSKTRLLIFTLFPTDQVRSFAKKLLFDVLDGAYGFEERINPQNLTAR